jgi:hypothetical protein
MQDVLEKIFLMATEELPHKVFNFGGEQTVLYKGFRISKKRGKYFWFDTRYDGYYDPVDPIITNNILQEGFYVTLNKLMVHNDRERLHDIVSEIETLNNRIQKWIDKANENWNAFLRQRKGIRASERMSDSQKKEKIKRLKKAQERKKKVYQKKRRVLREQKQKLESDRAYYVSRIKSINF